MTNVYTNLHIHNDKYIIYSPKHNVIVGRNGSGKSNFFDAIQFVLLGPKFVNLRQEDRQHLLHEGAGSSVMAAYVEIIFDNSDGRLSVDSDEVVIRRTVGHKKDEFFLNRKRVQKTEIQNLLESAGFSKSNPYYIVQQGKVANICTMKDTDRLNLLKEVAGTNVYEERRTESLKILQDTSSKQQQIEEVLQFIDDRLTELQGEKEELIEFDSLDKQRRALEYTVYDQELSIATTRLEQIEITREEEQLRHTTLHSDLRSIQDELALQEEQLLASKSTLDRLIQRQESQSIEIKGSIKRRSELEVQLQEAEIATQVSKNEKSLYTSQLNEINELIVACEDELESKIDPVYLSKQTKLAEYQQQISQFKHRIDALYGKQGRGRQFSTKKERDAFLQSQITILESEISTKAALIAKMKKDIEQEDNKLKKEDDFLSKAESESIARINRYKDLKAIINDKVIHRNQLQDQRKSSWRDLEMMQEKIQDTKQELEKGKNQLSMTLPRTVSNGLVTVEKIAAEKKITGYYGPLIDNIVLKNDAFRTAVEVAAGNSLFHVIVDTDVTAAYLMEELEKRKAGRLTFLPLNRLKKNVEIQYPDSNDVRPLIDVAIEYDEEFEPAIKHVFGKKLLARDLETAAHFSKVFQLDAITKEGDVVTRSGSFEGGYHDERASKIAAIQKIRNATSSMNEYMSQEMMHKSQSESIDNQVNELLRELQKLESERDHIRSNGEQLSIELSNRSKLLQVAQIALTSRSDGLNELNKEVQLAKEQVTEYKQEQKAPLLNNLNEAEKKELDTLSTDSKAIQSSIESLESELLTISSRREQLKADLNNNLLKRKEEVTVKLAAPGGSSGSKDYIAELETLKLEKEHLLSSLTSLENEMDSIVSNVDVKKSEVAAIEKAIEAIHEHERSAVEDVNEATKMQDKLLNKRTILIETLQQKQQLIRELGTLPRKELAEFKDYNEKELYKLLKVVNEKLKKYAGVNKKALDQYISFNEQREQLISRKEELTSDNSSIQNLVDSLDAKREEAILRTFRGVSHHFQEVFSELVPGGVGVLIMRTTADLMEESLQQQQGLTPVIPTQTGSSSDQLTQQSIATFQGVQVRVTFAGSGQQFEMTQLSGGQKALVALAIIFAIQRCDPAPFYLFDEIDQALDANYRAAVARLIQKQVSSPDAPAQFITTTFRPELVAVANKWYGIALMNKVSNIIPLAKQEAQNFVTSLMHEESVGKVNKVPAYIEEGNEEGEEEEEVDGDGDDHKDDDVEIESGGDDDDEVDDEGIQVLSELADVSVDDKSKKVSSSKKMSSSSSVAAVASDGESEEESEEENIYDKVKKKSSSRSSKKRGGKRKIVQ